MHRTGIISLWLVCLAPSAAPPSVAPLPSPDGAETWVEWNSRFQQSDGWIGGDGAYSVAVTPQRTLWLFSDSWVGKVREGKRTDATIVNNAIGVQEGHGDQARLRFVIRQGTDGKPAAMITPADGSGWFWLQGGVAANGKLYLFMAQIKRTGDGVFGFRQIGETLGVVENPLADPTEWRIEQKKIPFVDFGDQRFLSYGAAILAVGDDIYVYGTDETQEGQKRPNKHLVVARVKASSIDDFSTWRFFDNGHWDVDFQKAEHLTDSVANELSVVHHPSAGRFVLVYTDKGMSDKIVARVSVTPGGPWSSPTVLYQCPEMSADEKVFTYGAKVHPAESAGNELMITYVTNSFDFWQVARDARLYWPKVVRVRLKDHGD